MKDLYPKVCLLVALLPAFCLVGALIPTHPDWTRHLPTTDTRSLAFSSSSQQQQQKRSCTVSLSAAATTTSYTEGSHTSTSRQSSAGTIQDLLFFTNEERRRQGLSELRYNQELESAAQRHASDMAKNNYFSHDGLDGRDLKDRVGLTDYRYTNVGENLFWRTPDNDPSYAVQGWMESTSHRKNMLDPQFTEIGFGYAVDPMNAKHYYVQVFGRPLETPNTMGGGAIGAAGVAEDPRQIILQATNAARQRQGLPPFDMSLDLTQGAQEHAEEMMRSGELISKLKRGSYDRFFTNVGARFDREVFNDPFGAVQGWLDKGPQSDMLSERFTETGVGYATDGKQHFYAQLFGTPMETGVGRRDVIRAGNPPVSSSRATPRPLGIMRAGDRSEKKQDTTRNGDFGRMGFGGNNNNLERRQDADEVDNQWMDDKKVLQTLQNRNRQNRRPSPVHRMSNNNNSGMGRENRFGGGGGGDGLKPTGSDGFNDDWNRDYAGTANKRDYEMGPNGAMMRRSLMPGGGGAGPIPMRSQQDIMNPSGPRYSFDLPQRMSGLDRRTGFGRDGPGYPDRPQPRSRSLNGPQTSNGRQQIRRPTPTAIAGQPRREDQIRDGSVNDIHFQRHQLQYMDRMSMGMDEEMMHGPPPPPTGMRGPGSLYGRNQMSGPGMYATGMYDRTQMRDPAAYGRYDFGQPPQQRVGPMNDYMRGQFSNIGMGASSEFGRGMYSNGPYSYRNQMMDLGMGGGWNGMRGGGRVAVRPDEFGP